MIVTLHCKYSHDENGHRYWGEDNCVCIMMPAEVAMEAPKGIMVTLMTEDELETITDFRKYQLKKAMFMKNSAIVKPLQLIAKQNEMLEYQDSSYFKLLEHVKIPVELFDDEPEMVKIGIEYY